MRRRTGWRRAATAAGALAFLIASGAPADAESKCKVGKLAEIPVTMEGLRPVVHVKLNGKDAALIADSGAFYSLLSPGAAAEYGLSTTVLPNLRVSGIGGSIEPSMTTVRTFTILSVDIHNVQFIVGGSDMGYSGVLGQNFFALEDAEFDLAHGVIRLMRSSNCGSTPLAYWAAGKPFSVINWEVGSDEGERPHISGSVTINGVRLRVTFDTGAPVSVLSQRAAERIGLRPGGPGVEAAGLGGGLGRRLLPTWIGPVDSFKIGYEEVKHTKLRFGPVPNDADFDMLLGADFFLSHHIYASRSQRKIYLTYNGGRVFDLSARPEADGRPQAAVASGEPEPTDAAGYSRRGQARAARGDLAAGVADLDRAIALAPDDPDYRQERAVLRLQRSDDAGAIEDLDRTIKLRPASINALLMRASLRLKDEPKAARADLDAAAAAAPKTAHQRLSIAGMYDAVEAYPAAVQQYDLWIATHPDDSRRATALNGRCWARALMGSELDRALRDCNAALGIQPHMPGILDSRGLVHLRMGDFAKAIVDYDAALATTPDLAWSHYGRGIAELRVGRKQDGEADLAKAKALDADLPDKAAKLGIKP